MVIPALQTLLDRIETWPTERQERLAAVVDELDGRDADEEARQLSDEDAAEVARRLADENPETISMEEFRERFRDYLA